MFPDLPIFHGLPWWVYVLIALTRAHATIISVTLYLHRHQTHRSIKKIHPLLAHVFRFILFLVGLVTKEWVAIHRYHHAKVDTRDDPHSPLYYGLARVVFLGVFLYRSAARDKKMLTRYGAGTPDDWIENHLYTPWSWLGIVFTFVADIILFGKPGLYIWIAHMLTIPILGAGVINGLGHAWGYRNYNTHDRSRNILPFGWVIGGEELHNNHHRRPETAKLSCKRWEFDIGWGYIVAFRALGLMKGVQTAS